MSLAPSSLRRDHRIQLRVVEAKFPGSWGEVDAYCSVRIVQAISSVKSARKTSAVAGDYQLPVVYRTSIIWRTRECAFWDHAFDIELTADFKHVEIEVWSKRLLKDVLIGSVAIPAYDLHSQSSKPRELWYALRAERDNDTGSTASISSPISSQHVGSAASVRIRHLYTNEHVLPLPIYKPLLNILVDQKMHLVSALERTVDDRDETAKLLLRIMIYMELHEPYLYALTSREIALTPVSSLLFRGNSIASKSLDYFMKMVASTYLTRTLQPIVKGILSDNRNCEIDKSRLDRNETFEENFTILEAYLKWTTERILNSINDCPPVLRAVFRSLQQQVVERWPNEPNVKYIAVSSFIFLRLFNAAILGPKLFNLCEQHPTFITARTLTLLSKALQQLANLLPFDGHKEPFMTPFNNYIVLCIPRMKLFLDAISSTGRSLAMPAQQQSQQLQSYNSTTSLPLLQIVSSNGASYIPTSTPSLILPRSLSNSAPPSVCSSAVQLDADISSYSSCLSINTSPLQTPNIAASTSAISSIAWSMTQLDVTSSMSHLARSSMVSLSTTSEDALSPMRDKSDKNIIISRKGFLRKLMSHKEREKDKERDKNISSKSNYVDRQSVNELTNKPSIPSDIIKNIDIELQLAALHRILVKHIDKMQRTCGDEEAPTINRLAILLREMNTILERRTSSPSNPGSFAALANLSSENNINKLSNEAMSTTTNPFVGATNITRTSSTFARNNSGGAFPDAHHSYRDISTLPTSNSISAQQPLPGKMYKSATTDSIIGTISSLSSKGVTLLRKSGSSPLSMSLAQTKEELLHSNSKKITGSKSGEITHGRHRSHASLQSIHATNTTPSSSHRHIVISSPIVNSSLTEQLQLSGYLAPTEMNTNLSLSQSLSAIPIAPMIDHTNTQSHLIESTNPLPAMSLHSSPPAIIQSTERSMSVTPTSKKSRERYESAKSVVSMVTTITPIKDVSTHSPPTVSLSALPQSSETWTPSSPSTTSGNTQSNFPQHTLNFTYSMSPSYSSPHSRYSRRSTIMPLLHSRQSSKGSAHSSACSTMSNPNTDDSLLHHSTPEVLHMPQNSVALSTLIMEDSNIANHYSNNHDEPYMSSILSNDLLASDRQLHAHLQHQLFDASVDDNTSIISTLTTNGINRDLPPSLHVPCDFGLSANDCNNNNVDNVITPSANKPLTKLLNTYT